MLREFAKFSRLEMELSETLKLLAVTFLVMLVP